MSTSMYAQFATDSDFEKKGIWVEFAAFRVLIARAGGANKKYERVLEAKTKPYKRAILNETMDPGKSLQIYREIYAESIVLKWEVKIPDAKDPDNEDKFTWKAGIENPEPGGPILPFNKDNVMLSFNNLPDLFLDLKVQAEKMALFRKQDLEDESKN